MCLPTESVDDVLRAISAQWQEAVYEQCDELLMNPELWPEDD